jgi:hypothetical protein
MMMIRFFHYDWLYGKFDFFFFSFVVVVSSFAADVVGAVPTTTSSKGQDEELMIRHDEMIQRTYHDDNILPPLPWLSSSSSSSSLIDPFFHHQNDDDDYERLHDHVAYDHSRHLPLPTTMTSARSDRVNSVYVPENDDAQLLLSQEQNRLQRNHQPDPPSTNQMVGNAHDVPSPYVGLSHDRQAHHEDYNDNRMITNRNSMNRMNYSRSTRKIPPHHPSLFRSNQGLNPTTLSMGCIYNETDLNTAISSIPNNVPTRIDVCTSYLTINTTKPFGFIVRNKVLTIHCNNTTTAQHACTMDAQHISRIFDMVQSNVTFYDFIFMNGNGTSNPFYANGGAIYVESSSIECWNCHFQNHTATYGGAMILFNSVLRMYADHPNINSRSSSQNGTTSATVKGLIQGNIANRSGGFLYADRSSIYLEYYDVRNNSASTGGAMILYDSVLRMNAKHTNINSSFSLNETMTATGSIQNNVATMDGGFLNAVRSSIHLEYYDVMNNSASTGSAMILFDSVLQMNAKHTSINSSFSLNGTTTATGSIQNNVATMEGGFLNAVRSSIHLEHYDVMNNSASTGGAMILFDSVLRVNAKHSTINSSFTLDGTMTATGSIQNNIAKMYGGFLYAVRSSLHLEYYGVRNNVAQDAGGFLYGNEATIFISQSNFLRNKAGFGGAIYLDRSNATLVGNTDPSHPVLMENNVAGRAGGFLYCWNCSDFNATIGYFIFRRNTASVCFNISHSTLNVTY